MEQPPKDVRVRVEAPPQAPEPISLYPSEGLPKIYYLLIVLTFVFSGLSLFLSFSS